MIENRGYCHWFEMNTSINDKISLVYIFWFVKELLRFFSCFLLAMESDSIEGIYNTLKQCAIISKSAGGIGLHVHNIRSFGSYIAGVRFIFSDSQKKIYNPLSLSLSAVMRSQLCTPSFTAQSYSRSVSFLKATLLACYVKSSSSWRPVLCVAMRFNCRLREYYVSLMTCHWELWFGRCDGILWWWVFLILDSGGFSQVHD